MMMPVVLSMMEGDPTGRVGHLLLSMESSMLSEVQEVEEYHKYRAGHGGGMAARHLDIHIHIYIFLFTCIQ